MPSPRELPLLKLALALILGIVVQSYLQIPTIFLGVLFISSFTALLSLHKIFTIDKIHLFRSFIIYLSFVLIGALILNHKNSSIRNDFLDEHAYEPITALITCESIPKVGNITQFTAKVTHIGQNYEDLHQISSVHALIHIFDFERKIEVGHRLLINAEFKNTSKSPNPRAFDYSRHLKLKDISYQTYLYDDQILEIDNISPKAYFLSGSLRAKALDIFGQHLSPKNMAVASALVLGHRGLIDDDMYRSFAQTGSMHVLAVSGLHVGIVSTFLSILLGFIRSNILRYRILKVSVLLVGIWSFAILTGGSPSVVRASIMFSCIEVGKIWNGHYSVYNSIGAAALGMLIWNPFNLFQVGFQLSFAAILSIVIFFKKINNILSISNPIGNLLWKLVSVAISVQILTMPIAIFYFHQFPVYFFVTGITAVLLAMLILGMGLALLMLSIFPWPLDLLFQGYNSIISVLVESTELIHSLPFGLIQNIHFDVVLLALLFVVIAGLSIYIFFANRKSLQLALAFMAILFCYQSVQKCTDSRNKEIILYDAKYPLIDVIDQGTCYLYADKRLTQKNISYSVDNYRISKHVSKVIRIESNIEFVKFLNKNEELLKDFDLKSYTSRYSYDDFVKKSEVRS